MHQAKPPAPPLRAGRERADTILFGRAQVFLIHRQFIAKARSNATDK
jgi:hypothetical protein